MPSASSATSCDEFDYTLDFVGRDGDAPLEDFLFKYRSGHCELFASAMVLLLRSQGIHARLVTGFLGGELNRLGYVVVRQGNAHAWVEAWIPGEGWRTFDPTPPSGRPAMAEQSFASLAGQLYDSLVFQWDRYVLTYGVEDQAEVVLRLWRQLHKLWRLWDGDEEAMADDAPTAAVAGTAAAGGEAGDGRRLAVSAVLLLLAVVLAILLWRRHRAGFTATRAYRQLRGSLGARRAAAHRRHRTAGVAAARRAALAGRRRSRRAGGRPLPARELRQRAARRRRPAGASHRSRRGAPCAAHLAGRHAHGAATALATALARLRNRHRRRPDTTTRRTP